MKNEKTFKIELDNLRQLFMDCKFDDGEQLATRMLRDYNSFDYEIFL